MSGTAKWTPEMDAELCSLWRKGMSGSEVAKAMNLTKGAVVGRLWRPTLTKNAVVGRLWRLGEPKRDIPVKVMRPRQRRHSDGISSRVRQKLTRMILCLPDRPLLLFADNNPHPNSNVGLVCARERHCREIVGKGADGLALFCGEAVAHRSYCAYHAGLNYTMPRRHVQAAA